MSATCDFKEPGTDKACGAPASWVADIEWVKDTSAYQGTAWSVTLCESHYQEMLAAGRITGTAHPVAG